MKNQNDLIVLICSFVLCVAGVLTCVFTAPKPTAPAAPKTVPTARAQLQEGAVVYADTLPGSGNTPGGGGGGRGDAGGGRMAPSRGR